MEYKKEKHTSGNNNWEIGEIVKVGFLNNLKVTGKEFNKYFLSTPNGKKYEFIPYQGIYKIKQWKQ